MKRAFNVEELREDGGSYISINDPHGFVDAHVGSPEYISTHSYAYENPGLLDHIAMSVPDAETIAYINHASVDEGRRGMGLGSDLMKRMLKELKRCRVVRVFGHMAESTGEPRIRLERWLGKFGFRMVDCCKKDLLPVVMATLD